MTRSHQSSACLLLAFNTLGWLLPGCGPHDQTPIDNPRSEPTPIHLTVLPDESQNPAVRTISSELFHWALERLEPSGRFLLDVRTPDEFAAVHIPGATVIPVQVLSERLGEVPAEKPIYVYCRSGRRSLRAANILAQHGFNPIYNLHGGILGWPYQKTEQPPPAE